MTAASFMDCYIRDNINNIRDYKIHGNISYSGRIFQSYCMRICECKSLSSGIHIFLLIDDVHSPSRTTTKHIKQLETCINKIREYNRDVLIQMVDAFDELAN